MTALSPDQISELLAGQRGRGEYDRYLDEFMASGDAGRQVDLNSGVLAGKTPEKVKTGIENAKKRMVNGQPAHPGSEHVKVIKKDENVFVIDTRAVGGDVADEADEDAA